MHETLIIEGFMFFDKPCTKTATAFLPSPAGFVAVHIYIPVSDILAEVITNESSSFL